MKVRVEGGGAWHETGNYHGKCPYVYSSIDSSGVAIVQKWTEYLKEDSDAEELLLEMVGKRATWFDVQFILKLFWERSEELEVIECFFS